MRFDFTHGKPAKYMVSLYSWNVEDHYYFSDWQKAKEFFNKVKSNLKKGESLSLWDMTKDIRKEFTKA